MGHKGYYGQYTGNSKFSKKQDEAYDAKEAYNKDLTASARLHYLENDRHDHESPAKFIGKKRGEAGFEQDPQEARYERKSRKMDRKKKRKAKRNAAAQKHCMN